MSVDVMRWRAAVLAGLVLVGAAMGAALPIGSAGRLMWMFSGVHVPAGWAATLCAAGLGAAVVVGNAGLVIEEATFGAVAFPLPRCLGGPLMRRMSGREEFNEFTVEQQRVLLVILAGNSLRNAFAGDDFYVLGSRSGIRPRLRVVTSSNAPGTAPEESASRADHPPLRVVAEAEQEPSVDSAESCGSKPLSGGPTPPQACSGSPERQDPVSAFAAPSWRRRVLGRWFGNVIEIGDGDLDEYRRQWKDGEEAMDLILRLAGKHDKRLKRDHEHEMATYHLYGAARASLLLGSIAGYAYAVVRINQLSASSQVLLLILTGLGLAGINLAWILLVTYPARRRRRNRAFRIRGATLSTTLAGEDAWADIQAKARNLGNVNPGSSLAPKQTGGL